MNDKLELQIQRLLAMGQSAESIGQSLVENATASNVPEEMIPAVGYFLFQSGQYPLLFTFIGKLCAAEKTIPWGAMVLSLYQLTDNIPPSYMELIMTGAEDQGELAQILPVKNLERFGGRFSDERKKYLQHLRDQYDAHKKTMLDKIFYLKSQRVIEEEGRAIAEFKLIHPGDSQIPALENDFNRRKVEHMMSRLESPPKERGRRPKVPPAPHELQPWITELVRYAISEVKSSRQSGIDLALTFYFLELYHEALAVISHAPESKTGNWLTLELKILAGRYVDAIEESRRLEALYATDPDSTFATTYARAQCLWELGQTSLAIGLLQGIVNIRPHFRSASSLLKQWSEDLA